MHGSVGAEEDDLGVDLDVFFLALDTISHLVVGLLLARPEVRGQGGARLAA
jgi:hypothetical protein